MSHTSRRSHLGRARRASALVALSAMILGGAGHAAPAASPYRRTFLACSNGDFGDDGACKRLCRSFLNRKDNPLGAMRATCLRRLDTKRNVYTDPD